MHHGQPAPHAAPAPAGAPRSPVEKILPVLSVFTMVMTVPQAWGVWAEGETAGVSLLSWGAYFVSACLWFVYGLHKRDRTIWVACIGWVLLDGAVFIGALVRA